MLVWERNAANFIPEDVLKPERLKSTFDEDLKIMVTSSSSSALSQCWARLKWKLALQWWSVTVPVWPHPGRRLRVSMHTAHNMHTAW